MNKKITQISFTEYLAFNMLDVNYDDMSSDAEAEFIAEILHENLCYTAKDGTKYEVNMTDEEWSKLVNVMKDFVSEHYDDAVKIVDEANEDARDYEESRRAYLEGRI